MLGWGGAGRDQWRPAAVGFGSWAVALRGQLGKTQVREMCHYTVEELETQTEKGWRGGTHRSGPGRQSKAGTERSQG